MSSDMVKRRSPAVGLARHIATAAAIVLLGALASRVAAQVRPPDEILFTDDIDGATDLFVLDPSTWLRIGITRTPSVREVEADWSPDRRRIAFAADEGGLWRIWVLDRRTGAAAALTSGPGDLDPDWSPDGTELLFTAHFNRDTADQASFLMIADTHSGTTRPVGALFDPRHSIAGPRWSPDGRHIVFVVASADRGAQLYTVGSDGSGARRLLAHPGWHDVDPAWSPDGRRIAFASGPFAGTAETTRHDIWLLDLDRGIAGTILVDETRDLRRPAWSPDGARIALDARSPEPGGAHRLHVTSALGGGIGPEVASGREADWASGPDAGPTGSAPTASATTGAGPTATASPHAQPEPSVTPPDVTDLPPVPTLAPFPTAPGAEPTWPWPPPTYPVATADVPGTGCRLHVPLASRHAGAASRP